MPYCAIILRWASIPEYANGNPLLKEQCPTTDMSLSIGHVNVPIGNIILSHLISHHTPH
jgi:hypothetical protein